MEEANVSQIITNFNVYLQIVVSEEEGSHSMKCTAFESHLIWEVRKFFLQSQLLLQQSEQWFGVHWGKSRVAVLAIEVHSFDKYLGDKILVFVD